MLKKSFVFLLVSVLALCSLCAFPTREVKSPSQQVELLPLEPITPVTASEAPAPKSESSAQGLSDDAILTLIEEKIDQIETEADFLTSEVARLEGENAALQAENVELALEVARQEVRLESAGQMKSFIRLGGEIAWKESVFTYGLTGAAGLRFRNGISLGVSLSYTIGTQHGIMDFSKDAFRATAFIEFEF